MKETPQPSPRALPQRLDESLLRFISLFDVVTSHQVIDRFFTMRDKSPVYGYRVLGRLVSDNLLISERVFPDLGAASITYVRLTRAGYSRIGEKPLAERLRPLPRPELEYKLQYAEMVLVRGVEGWRETRPEKAFERLRTWGLARFRGRTPNDHELILRSNLERMAPVPMRVPVLLFAQPGSPRIGEVRIVLPVRGHGSIRRTLSSLPPLAALSPVAFEIVCPDEDRLLEAVHMIEKHAAEGNYRFEIHRVRHFRERPNPRSPKA